MLEKNHEILKTNDMKTEDNWYIFSQMKLYSLLILTIISLILYIIYFLYYDSNNESDKLYKRKILTFLKYANNLITTILIIQLTFMCNPFNYIKLCFNMPPLKNLHTEIYKKILEICLNDNGNSLKTYIKNELNKNNNDITKKTILFDAINRKYGKIIKKINSHWNLENDRLIPKDFNDILKTHNEQTIESFNLNSEKDIKKSMYNILEDDNKYPDMFNLFCKLFENLSLEKKLNIIKNILEKNKEKDSIKEHYEYFNKALLNTNIPSELSATIQFIVKKNENENENENETSNKKFVDDEIKEDYEWFPKDINCEEDIFLEYINKLHTGHGPLHKILVNKKLNSYEKEYNDLLGSTVDDYKGELERRYNRNTLNTLKLEWRPSSNYKKTSYFLKNMLEHEKLLKEKNNNEEEVDLDNSDDELSTKLIDNFNENLVKFNKENVNQYDTKLILIFNIKIYILLIYIIIFIYLYNNLYIETFNKFNNIYFSIIFVGLIYSVLNDENIKIINKGLLYNIFMMLVIINSILKLYINTIDEYAEGNDITYKLIKANADIKRHFEKKDTDSTKDKLKALYHLKYYNSGSESIDKLYKYFKEDTKINNKTFTNEEKNAIINKLGKEHKTQNEAIFDSNIKLNNLMAYDDIKKETTIDNNTADTLLNSYASKLLEITNQLEHDKVVKTFLKKYPNIENHIKDYVNNPDTTKLGDIIDRKTPIPFQLNKLIELYSQVTNDNIFINKYTEGKLIKRINIKEYVLLYIYKSISSTIDGIILIYIIWNIINYLVLYSMTIEPNVSYQKTVDQTYYNINIYKKFIDNKYFSNIVPLKQKFILLYDGYKTIYNRKTIFIMLYIFLIIISLIICYVNNIKTLYHNDILDIKIIKNNVLIIAPFIYIYLIYIYHKITYKNLNHLIEISYMPSGTNVISGVKTFILYLILFTLVFMPFFTTFYTSIFSDMNHIYLGIGLSLIITCIKYAILKYMNDDKWYDIIGEQCVIYIILGFYTLGISIDYIIKINNKPEKDHVETYKFGDIQPIHKTILNVFNIISIIIISIIFLYNAYTFRLLYSDRLKYYKIKELPNSIDNDFLGPIDKVFNPNFLFESPVTGSKFLKNLKKGSEMKGGDGDVVNNSNLYRNIIFVILVCIVVYYLYNLCKKPETKKMKGGLLAELLLNNINFKNNIDKDRNSILLNIFFVIMLLIILIILISNDMSDVEIQNNLSFKNMLIYSYVGTIILGGNIVLFITILYYGFTENNLECYLDSFTDIYSNNNINKFTNIKTRGLIGKSNTLDDTIEKCKKIYSYVTKYKIYINIIIGILLFIFTIIIHIRTKLDISKVLFVLFISMMISFFINETFSLIYKYLRLEVISVNKINKQYKVHIENKTLTNNNKIIIVDNKSIALKDKKILNKNKKNIIDTLEKIKEDYNIMDDITMNIGIILDKWKYPKDKNNISYIDIYKEKNSKDKYIKDIIEEYNTFKEKYDGVWNINNEETSKTIKNNVEKIIIKTYGINCLIIILNNVGYIINKYNMIYDKTNDIFYDKNNNNNKFEYKTIKNKNYILYNKNYYEKLHNIQSDLNKNEIRNYLKNSNDFMKNISKIINPIKDAQHIIKSGILDDLKSLNKITNKCEKNLIIEIIIYKTLFIQSIKKENYLLSDKLNKILDTLNNKYNNIKTLKLNSNKISLAIYNNNELTVNMKNIIGNVISFTSKKSENRIETHKHSPSTKSHTHKVSTPESDPLIIKSDQLYNNKKSKNYDNKLHSHIGLNTNKTHTNESIYLNNKICTDTILSVPESINTMIQQNSNLLRYIKDKDNKHHLIFRNNITKNDFDNIISKLDRYYTNFHTGNIKGLFKFMDNNNKIQEININALINGFNSSIILNNEININKYNETQIKLKNVEIRGNMFDTNKDNPCKIESILLKEHDTIYIKDVNFSSEFC